MYQVSTSRWFQRFFCLNVVYYLLRRKKDVIQLDEHTFSTGLKPLNSKVSMISYNIIKQSSANRQSEIDSSWHLDDSMLPTNLGFCCFKVIFYGVYRGKPPFGRIVLPFSSIEALQIQVGISMLIAWFTFWDEFG